jgi:hypothetical protein
MFSPAASITAMAALVMIDSAYGVASTKGARSAISSPAVPAHLFRISLDARVGGLSVPRRRTLVVLIRVP